MIMLSSAAWGSKIKVEMVFENQTLDDLNAEGCQYKP